jgi:hypothetical protein
MIAFSIFCFALKTKAFLCRWIRTELQIEEVLATFIDDPHSSLRQIERMEGMPSRNSIHRILKVAKYHPYRLQLLQKLRPQDCQRRIDHALTQLALMEIHPSFLHHLQFSDEAHFHVNGVVNRQNFRYWDTTNPFCYSEQPLHSPRITVWGAIGCQGVIGPFFFHGNVTGASYLDLLQQQFLPAAQQFPEFHELVFMQDGAPPHWSLRVREWLSVTFPNRWMGRNSPNLPWPPYSPDLTPMDFFLWGWVKDRVYHEPISDIVELRLRIQEAFQVLPMDMVKRSIDSYVRRLHRCIENGGQSVERENR